MPSRNTRQRQLVLQAVRSRTDHPRADDIYLAVRQQDARISRGTVYRNLGALSAAGLINHIKVAAADRFDLRLDKHYHMLCTGCGIMVDAPLDYQPQLDAAAAAAGFTVQRHRTVFEGLCPACRAAQRQD